MKRTPIVISLVLLVAAACGDDDGAPTTAAADTTVAASTAAETTATTAATTTTTTTVPEDLHPAWGIGWSAVWPAESAVASYRVEIMGGDPVETAARVEYAVEWRGGTWDRLVLGTVEPGQDGAALYFARPEPWVLRLWGVEQTATDRDDTVLEYFAEPQDLDLTLLPDESPTIEGNMIVEHGFGTSDPIPVVYQLESIGVEDVEVAAGTAEGAYHWRIGLGGDFYPTGEGGEITFFSDLWVHPEQFLVKWDPAPSGGPIELAEPWPAHGSG